MRDWIVILGGLVCWTLHFGLVYCFASMADLSDPAMRSLWSWLGAAGTVACLLAVTLIAIEASSKRGLPDLARQLGLGGCTISGVAIVWQSLPLFVAG